MQHITQAALARICDVSSAAVYQWRLNHSDFPLPIQGCKTVFQWPEIKQWLDAHYKYYNDKTGNYE